MEDIAAYIILFSIGLGVLYAYQSRRLSPRQFPLSVQTFPECLLTVFVTKQHGKTQTLVVQINARKNLSLGKAFLELIAKDRSINLLPLNTKNKVVEMPDFLSEGQQTEIKLPFEEFSTELKSHGKPFRSFRIVVEDTNGKKYKSHEMAFNKNWSIYRPDSGKYN